MSSPSWPPHCDITPEFEGLPCLDNRVGDLRFNLPVAVDPYNGTFIATSYGPACPQQAFDLPELSDLPEDTVNFIVNHIYQVFSPAAEDCELRILHCLSICPSVH